MNRHRIGRLLAGLVVAGAVVLAPAAGAQAGMIVPPGGVGAPAVVQLPPRPAPMCHYGTPYRPGLPCPPHSLLPRPPRYHY